MGDTSRGRESYVPVSPIHEVDMAYITGHVRITLNIKTVDANYKLIKQIAE